VLDAAPQAVFAPDIIMRVAELWPNMMPEARKNAVRDFFDQVCIDIGSGLVDVPPEPRFGPPSCPIGEMGYGPLSVLGPVGCGAPGRIRTSGLCLRRAALYPLSYERTMRNAGALRGDNRGAEGGSRTHTSVSSLRPERSASAYSATSARLR
jgi:hypothetical protein